MPLSIRPAVLLAIAVAIAAVVWTFLPSAGFAFLNWDDQSVILQNPSLDFPGIATWAFTTTYMQHYQPLSWLVWGGLKAAFGLDAAVFHVANVVAHTICVVLLWLVTREVVARAWPALSRADRDFVGVAAALLYGVHPLRVEVVAWVSALPYAIALALLLASLLSWLRSSSFRAESGSSIAWPVTALALYAASLGARPVALGFPAVLVVLDSWLFDRRLRASVFRAWPFAGLAAAAALVESVARGPGLGDAPWLYRLQSAVSAPFVYLWHTVLPVGLTPLDLMPLSPAPSPPLLIGAVLGMAGTSALAWRWRREWPGAAAAWAVYLALLVPAAGLVPSGLQATADRYSYLPGVVIAIAVAGAAARWATGRPARVRLVAGGLVVLSMALALGARQMLSPWSDSVSLWTRVVSLDPGHDVGLYNLGVALAAEGRAEEAAVRYRDVLVLQPGHPQARAELNRLDAVRFEQEGNDLAGRGDLAGAAERYRQAVGLDPQRTHSQAALGMALASLGQSAEAIPALREAIRQGTADASVPNALGVLLVQSGRTSEARAVFEAALAIHQTDVGLAYNLARLLATSPGLDAKDRQIALDLARAVVEATGGRDARVLDTLAAALAANGRRDEAITTSQNAAALAAEQGDNDLAVQITARGRAYRNPGQ